MKFYDLGDNDYDMASPYRLHVPERGLDVSYGKPGAVVFVTTDGYQDDNGMEAPGRCIFGLNGELHHGDLKKYLEDGERITMRGVVWPELDVAVTWQFYRNMAEFREYMKVFAGGLRDELSMNPDDVLLYLGYLHKSDDGMRGSVAYNVEIPVSEACVVAGNGNVNDCFYAMFLKDGKAGGGDEDETGNGMRNRDIWRHYQVVGENKAKNKTTYRKTGTKMKNISDKRLNQIISESIHKVIEESSLAGPFKRSLSQDPEMAKQEARALYEYIRGCKEQAEGYGLDRTASALGGALVALTSETPGYVWDKGLLDAGKGAGQLLKRGWNWAREKIGFEE